MLVWVMIEGFAKGMLYWKFRPNVDDVMQFFPIEAMANLIKEPFTRLSAVKTVAKQVGEDLSKDFSVQPLDLIIVAVWTAIFIYFSYKLLKRRDL